MNNIDKGVIQVLDQLKNSGQLNSYLIDDDERKWTKLVYDIMINKFDMPFGNGTMQQASDIFNNAVRVWKGKNKLGNMMNMESRTMNKKLIRLTENDLHKIVKESVEKILSESDYDNFFDWADNSSASPEEIEAAGQRHDSRIPSIKSPRDKLARRERVFNRRASMNDPDIGERIANRKDFIKNQRQGERFRNRITK